MNRAILGVLILFAAFSCNLFTPQNNTEQPESHNELLQGLGIDTNSGARKDPNEIELSDSYNPIGPKVGILFRQCEIYAAGMSINGEANGLLEDQSDGNGNFPVLFQESNSDWDSGYPKRSIAADVDGDGLDEIVTAVFYPTTNEIALRLVDYDGSTQNRGEIQRITSEDDFSQTLDGTAGGSDDWEDAFLRQDLQAGDLDGDGKQELLIIEARQIYILDDINSNFRLLNHFTLPNLNGDTDTYIRASMADFDMDGLDEIIIINGEGSSNIVAELTIFDDLSADNDLSNPLLGPTVISTTIDGESIQLHSAGVVTGDFDGDGIPEAAIAGQRYSNSDFATIILDCAMDSKSEVQFSFLDTYMADNNENSYFIPAMAAGDIDGDGVDELVVWEDIYKLSSEHGELDYHDLWGNEALTTGLPGEGTRGDAPSIDILSVGDVTGDKKADVVFYTTSGDKIRVVSVQSAGTLGFNDISVGSGPSRPTLCLPNVDNDSAVLEYLEHEVLFTDPVLIAVIASPPYWAGINGTSQGYVGSTSFGYISGQSSEQNESHGFSVGFSVGSSFQSPFGLAEAEIKTTVENSFNWGVATTHEVTESWGYSTNLGEDKVVFTAIPFDVYYYQILSSPDASQIGENISINIPRAPEKYNQSISYFNAHNGDGYDISSDVVTHTPGDPFSYHSKTERDILKEDLQEGLFSEHQMTVGVDTTGNTEISLDQTETDTNSFDYSLDVSVEAEVSIGGVLAGASAGFNYDYGYSTSYTTGTYVQGSVPDVPDVDYLYTWGLLAYPVQDQGQKFTLVTYWTED